MGILCSGIGVEVRDGLPRGGVVPVCVPGEEENLDDMLDSHEFRREVVPGDGDFAPPFCVTVLSVELLLENPGRWGVVLGEAGVGVASLVGCGMWTLPLCDNGVLSVDGMVLRCGRGGCSGE